MCAALIAAPRSDAFQVVPVVTTVPLIVTLAAVVPPSEADELTASPVAERFVAVADSAVASEPDRPIVLLDDRETVPYRVEPVRLAPEAVLVRIPSVPVESVRAML